MILIVSYNYNVEFFAETRWPKLRLACSFSKSQCHNVAFAPPLVALDDPSRCRLVVHGPGGLRPGLDPNVTVPPPLMNATSSNGSNPPDDLGNRSWWFWQDSSSWWFGTDPNVSTVSSDYDLPPHERWFI